LKSIVITTIQEPTASARRMHEAAGSNGFRLIVVGDRKTPAVEWPELVQFVSIEAQLKLEFSLARLLPENHYARKNIGYLLAAAQQSTCVYDTDDDNAPLSCWQPRTARTSARPCMQSGWVNAYRWFTESHVWPRGLPLDQARRRATAPALGDTAAVEAPIQQGLANGSPDVDAVWRLLMDQEITFAMADSVSLAPGTWCPFNSQSTWWFPAAYPLMYLPSFVSFRMTDIWRSFIAQRCLWALGLGVVFHGPEVVQDRNPHNLLRDFEQEVPGYLGNDRFRDILEGLSLSAAPDHAGHNLHRCYEALVTPGLIPAEEMALVEAWLADLDDHHAGNPL